MRYMRAHTTGRVPNAYHDGCLPYWTPLLALRVFPKIEYTSFRKSQYLDIPAFQILPSWSVLRTKVVVRVHPSQEVAVGWHVFFKRQRSRAVKYVRRVGNALCGAVDKPGVRDDRGTLFLYFHVGIVL